MKNPLVRTYKALQDNLDYFEKNSHVNWSFFICSETVLLRYFFLYKYIMFFDLLPFCSCRSIQAVQSFTRYCLVL